MRPVKIRKVEPALTALHQLEWAAWDDDGCPTRPANASSYASTTITIIRRWQTMLELRSLDEFDPIIRSCNYWGPEIVAGHVCDVHASTGHALLRLAAKLERMREGMKYVGDFRDLQPVRSQ